ncbi:MAG: solute carrier family 12 sodium/potassium/chloride transporter 2 [Bacteroidia bacterium]|jgi:solute carrier family 12 sodium/potassium/chloride transporter 2
MSGNLRAAKANFGTLPVFLTAISTILGAVMFLRFGYAVGNVGFWGAVAIIVVGHMVTIPTAMALSEIATNQKVEGGGEYYIISRSFGINTGGAIGMALYLSQAISVAFYIVAFAEAFGPYLPDMSTALGFQITDMRLISVPALLLLIALMLTKGADLGMKALYVVVAILLVSLVMFFMGSPADASLAARDLGQTVTNPDNFFYVFAICFPAFTGMTAGVGLSGDLKDPSKSIPIGTMAATLVGMVIYVFIAYKLTISATPEALDSNQLVMMDIATWGPIIPIGLAAATISSALGSFMVAPRTLQALGNDKVFPSPKFNFLLAKGKKHNNEPFNATLLTAVIAIFFVLMGDVNFVAEIISMFFMVTYGTLNLISFLNHFSADPSYRPSFKSKWYISAIGAFLCFYLMFKMNTIYAILSLALVVIMYLVITFRSDEKKNLAAIFQGVIFQFSRRVQVFLQKAERSDETWRPSIVCLSQDTFERNSVFDMMKWLSHRYGFGTFVHHIKGQYNYETLKTSNEALERLIKQSGISQSNVFLDTLVNPSFTSSIVQTIQMPGISGKDNNMLLFEFKRDEPEKLKPVLENYHLMEIAKQDVCILGTSDRTFGYKNEIHIWITENDYENANLMIIMSYIILGHPEWKKGVIKIYALFPDERISEMKADLLKRTKSGRLPISPNNITVISDKNFKTLKMAVNQISFQADLVVLGFEDDIAKQGDVNHFTGYDKVGNILFFNNNNEIGLT